jgi:hypothetical protein
VLDSSVLVPRWSRIVLQQLAAQPRQRFAPVWSEPTFGPKVGWIIAETWRVLTWRWLARAANEMLRYLLPVVTLASIRDIVEPVPWPGLQDTEDAPTHPSYRGTPFDFGSCVFSDTAAQSGSSG